MCKMIVQICFNGNFAKKYVACSRILRHGLPILNLCSKLPFTEIGISLISHFPLIAATDLWGHSSSPNKIVLVTGKLTQIK